MAYLDATMWLDIQSTNATSDSRYFELGVLNLVKKSTDFVDYIRPSDEEKMRTLSSARDLQLPVIKEYTPTVVTTPGFAFIPANLPTTDQYTFVAYDVFSGFRFFPASFENNAVDRDYVRAENMKRIAYEMGKTIENILITNLEARKSQQLGFTTQVAIGTGSYTFSTVTDTLTLNKAAQDNTMFYSLQDLMAANELPGNYQVVTSPAGLTRQKAMMLQYGANNQQNIAALGFLPMDRLHESHQISAGSDNFVGYLVRDGAIGIYENFPYDFRAGTQFAGKTWSVSDADIPMVGLRCNIYVNNEATDATSLFSTVDSNLIMTHYEETAIWARFYVVYRYNGDLANRANDIVKIIGATS